MSATNYTPIYLYNSGTATNTPSAANLGAGELAINYADGKLFYKDGSAAVQVIAWKTTPTTAGGTGLTSYTAGDLPYYASGSALSKLGIGTANYVLTSSGTAPQYVAQSTLTVGNATNAVNVGTTDNTSSSSTYYPTLVSATSGNNPITTSSTKLSFVPSTGVLSANGVALTGNLGTVTSVAALTLGTSGTDLSSTVATGTTTPVITLNVPTASTTNRGALSAADWTTFNGKQAALVSGTNIKTVGGASLLGSGDVGTIGVAYGGTGLTSLTAGYIPYGNGTSAFSSGVGLTFDGTNLKLGTSNGGVIFNNSSALTNSTLNDYEVGTFTPVLAFGGGSTGIVYTNRSGNYTKVGNKVTVSIGIYLSSKGSSTGNATITGLPFTSLNAAFIASSGLIVGSINFLSTTFPLYGVVGGAATSISLQSSVNGNTNLTDTNFSNAMYFSISLTYLASF